MFYDLLKRFADRPSVFSHNSAKQLWTRPYIAQRMLAAHIDPLGDRASYRAADINMIVQWLDAEIGLNGKYICDLGCGPGLYTRRFAASGAHVTGVDFSTVSLTYAKEHSQDNTHPVSYLEADYLADNLPIGFDVITLISTDFCVLSKANRQLLLGRMSEMLNPSGKLIMDVAGMSALRNLKESTRIENQLMNGFWAEGDYIGLTKTLVYPEESVALDRYLIVEPEETWEVFNWMQYFSIDSLKSELQQGGFVTEKITKGLSDIAADESCEVLGVIASISR